MCDGMLNWKLSQDNFIDIVNFGLSTVYYHPGRNEYEEYTRRMRTPSLWSNSFVFAYFQQKAPASETDAPLVGRRLLQEILDTHWYIKLISNIQL